MYYDKKVKYLNYMEYGERVRGCGFVKAEVRDKSLNLEVNIKNLPERERCTGEIFLRFPGEERSLGKISLEEGAGFFQVRYNDLHNVFADEEYEKWSGIKIPLEGNREICGAWEESEGNVAFDKSAERVVKTAEIVQGERAAQEREEQEKRAQERAQQEREAQERRAQERVQQEQAAQEKRAQERVQQEREAQEKRAQERVQQEQAAQARKGEREAQERRVQERVQQEPEERMTEKKQERAAEFRLADEKWQQLIELYPHVHPFKDARDYLSINPSDLVLLSEKAFRRANNSFLLHGYFNYKHLLLGRVERRGELVYYVGTPGNYFEREKQVAIMFGFESFECAEEPAQAGDFGYYMMRVEI